MSEVIQKHLTHLTAHVIGDRFTCLDYFGEIVDQKEKTFDCLTQVGDLLGAVVEQREVVSLAGSCRRDLTCIEQDRLMEQVSRNYLSNFELGRFEIGPYPLNRINPITHPPHPLVHILKRPIHHQVQ